ncbi:MAG: STAS domain-containing protein [Candidatus Kapaibacterium sp.]|jgi:anti-anti-sigma factor|nr:STAS domain-containing protein [Candidatus Kapabacteria bacterium]
MNYTIEHKDNIVIFKLENQTVESSISAELKAKMLILAQPDIDALVIDMSSVEAIDSSGLGALLLANRQLKDHEIPVILTGVKDFVRSLMSMTKIDEVFEFFPTVDDAITALEIK